jgi:hypothetical protein
MKAKSGKLIARHGCWNLKEMTPVGKSEGVSFVVSVVNYEHPINVKPKTLDATVDIGHPDRG